MIQEKFALILSGLIIALLIGCSSEDKGPQTQGDLFRLASYMIGSFSSQEQAAADTNFYDIRLEVVRIWENRTDGSWLYVEHAGARMLDKPYRQRIYRLTQVDDSTFRSDVFSMRNPLRYAGEWKKPKPMTTVMPDSLGERQGCSMILKKEGDSAFVGGTVGIECATMLAGAKYTTTELRITATHLYSWDRGFDAEDKQVWGSTVGAYILKKIIK
ncbi:MAG: chromophore lyase CpcT/CpeT [Candidatus Zixiibacteriota bacterium]|nr:MAG: chromophore lyase CpcT/CpeT [candidate division Zixibacteria bacterium]